MPFPAVSQLQPFLFLHNYPSRIACYSQQWNAITCMQLALMCVHVQDVAAVCMLTIWEVCHHLCVGTCNLHNSIRNFVGISIVCSLWPESERSHPNLFFQSKVFVLGMSSEKVDCTGTIEDPSSKWVLISPCIMYTTCVSYYALITIEWVCYRTVCIFPLHNERYYRCVCAIVCTTF